jgi:hypothetical protein
LSGYKKEIDFLKKLKKLEKRDRVLTALENGGVDNWEWFGESLGSAGIDSCGDPNEDE